MNLGAAVQVLAYELRSHLDDAVLALPEFEPASHAAEQAMLAEMEKTLVEIGFHDPENPRRLMPRLRRFFAKAGLEQEEVAIWRGVLSAIQKNRALAPKMPNNAVPHAELKNKVSQ